MKKTAMTAFLFFSIMYSGCASTQSINDFTSDGCSLFPDGNLKDRSLWCDCCFSHDIAYWKGGTEGDRLRADESLKSCVLERTSDKLLAETMFLGVRTGGQPVFPTWYRWGYGWPYGRGYKALTEEEQKDARAKLDEYYRKATDGYCAYYKRR